MPKFNCEVLTMMVFVCLWLYNPLLLGESSWVPVQFVMEHGCVAK